MQAILDYFKYSQGNLYILGICLGISLFFFFLFIMTFVIHKRPSASPSKAIHAAKVNNCCPSCGKAAKDGAVFCKYCGNKLV